LCGAISNTALELVDDNEEVVDQLAWSRASYAGIWVTRFG